MMAAAQFGVTVCSLTLGAVAEPTVAALLEPVFHAVLLPEPLVHPAGYVIALAAVAFFHLVIGELVPKNLAMAAPERTALMLSPGLVAFARLCRPVTAAFGAAARGVLRLFRVEPKDEVDAVFTSEQLTHLVEDSRQAGLLADGEHERLSDALELGTRPVTEVLLDPAGLVTVGPSATPRQIEELTVRTGYSRFPLRGEDGAFLGYLHVKDVLELEDGDSPVPARRWRRMPTLRAELPLDEALAAMRAPPPIWGPSPTRTGPYWAWSRWRTCWRCWSARSGTRHIGSRRRRGRQRVPPAAPARARPVPHDGQLTLRGPGPSGPRPESTSP